MPINHDMMHSQSHSMFEKAGEVLEGVAKLKERIAELEKENDSLKYSVAALETDLAMSQRWRNAAEETPTDETEVPVILDNGWKTTDYFEKDKCRWHYHWHTVAYWFQTPKAPEEGK